MVKGCLGTRVLFGRLAFWGLDLPVRVFRCMALGSSLQTLNPKPLKPKLLTPEPLKTQTRNLSSESQSWLRSFRTNLAAAAVSAVALSSPRGEH